MSTFATEFPIRPLPSGAAFLAQVIGWLRGSDHSTLLDDVDEKDLDGEAPVLKARSGEELRLRVLPAANGLAAIGFRHDFPDRDGRLWRTEMVVRKDASANGLDMARLRTQCIAQRAGARLEMPKKPYLVKALLKEGWGARDGLLDVSDQPLWLADDDVSVELAREITLGAASRHLPVLYVSTITADRWALNRLEIEWLAFQLGGVAHVVVEPERGFAVRLRDVCGGRNVYGGTMGLALPGRGISRKLYLGGQLPDARALQLAALELACDVRSQMPAEAWDWTELQEQALRRQRERNRALLSQRETEELYEGEIAALKDQVGQLKDRLAHANVAEAEREEGLLPAGFLAKLGPEIYPGELQDRLRAAAKAVCANAERDGLDSRSRAVLGVLADLPTSDGLARLLADLRRVTKDPNRLAAEVTDLLSRHGFSEKSQNRHVRLEPKPQYAGLEAITVSKTPSDKRSLPNLRKQVERALGVTRLGD